MASIPQASEAASLSQTKSLGEPLVNSLAAACYLNVHPKTLQRMAREGKAPGHRIGKLWRFRISELDEWLRNWVTSNRHSCRENERR